MGTSGVTAATIWGGVPSKPDLGVTLNDEVKKRHLLEPGYFEPAPQWDKESGRVNAYSRRIVSFIEN